MKNFFFKILLVGTLCGGVGCGAGLQEPKEILFSESSGAVGYLHLNVANAENQLISELGSIEKYKIILEGEGMERKEKSFSKTTANLLIQGIPPGENRRILVQALNRKDQVLREGEVEGLSVVRGKVTRADIVLEAVPVVLNLSDGEYLSNLRLYFSLFSDAKHPLRVEQEGILQDVRTGLSELTTSASGLVRFYPPRMEAGSYSFFIRDLVTDKTMALTLHLWDGKGVAVAPLFTGSGVEAPIGEAIPKRFGEVFSQESSGSQTSNNFFPNIVRTLWRPF